MRANTATARSFTIEDFVPVDLRYFLADRPPILDLYVRLDDQDQRLMPARLSQSIQVVSRDGHCYARFGGADEPLGREARSRLLENGITRLFFQVRDGEPSAGGRTLDDVLALTDGDVSNNVKVSLIYEDVVFTARRALPSPAAATSVARTARSIDTLIRQIVYAPHSVRALVGLVRHESSIFTHSANVCVYATCLARMMGMSPEALTELATAALLHDVGMMKVPESITGKPGPLTPDERAVVQKHPRWGADLLSKAYRKQPGVVSVALQHHERADGTGYPSGLMGDQMTQFARMVGVIDKYEAITSDRPHRPAMHPYKATQAVRDELVGQFEQELFVPMLRMVSPKPS